MGKIFIFLSKAPLILGAAIPTIALDSSSKFIICTSSKPCTDTINVITTAGEDYSISVLPDDFAGTYSNVVETIDSAGTLISISQFEKIAPSLEDVVIISACRDHILKEYLPALKKINCACLLLTLDNNKSYAYKLRGLIDRNISVYACTVHSRCLRLKSANQSIISIQNDDPLMIFPPGPELADLKCYLYNQTNDIIKTASSLIFSEDEETYQIYQRAKLAYINAPHSMLCLLTYSVHPEAQPSDIFSAYPDVYDLLQENIALLYEKERRNYPEEIYINWEYASRRFIHNIFSDPKETLSRALMPTIEGEKKAYEHWKFLKDFDPHGTLEKGLHRFLSLVQK